MSLTIHLRELNKLAARKGYKVFKSTDEEVAEWKRKADATGRIPLRYFFREELFDKVSRSFASL
jgi:hypothetical protein